MLECLAQDHMEFLSTLEPQVFLYILSSISEGLNALGKLNNIKNDYNTLYKVAIVIENFLFRDFT